MNQIPTDFPDAGEIEVARILLDFPILFRKPKPLCGWGCKRRRSNWNSPADNEHHSQAPDPPPPPRAIIPGGTDLPARKRVKSGEGLSPVTPLSFPSESDDKPSRAHSKKRKIEELNRNVDELIKCREMRVGKLEAMMAFYNHQKAYNLKLRARKHELQLWSASKKRGEVCETSVGPNTSVVQQQKKHYQCVMGQGLQTGPMQGLSESQIRPGLFEQRRVGPGGMLGLNVSAQFLGGPAQPLDLARRMEGDKKARYAEARRSRMIKNSLKKKIRHSGSRVITLPHRRQ
ncbi:hypothetical protein DM860_006812 [Cuscuta australis]|uniref:Uncharacterized protein n=1 Tax=Cuscuta australis TaxID=267555 RepID=A0A328E6G4_9ASTE|nr:hypothetical protein DM860_006812 [Cuscuta australis]